MALPQIYRFPFIVFCLFYTVGMAFKDLYHECRENFLVNSDSVLRTQLTEFIDHNMVRNKRSVDGTEYLVIPIDRHILEQFSEQIG